MAVVGDVDLAADDRLDAGPLRRLEQLHGARHRPVIGERHSRHLELGGPLDEVGDPARTVEDRVLGVDVKVNERCVGHAERTPYKRPRRVPERFPQFGRIFLAGPLWNARGRVRAPGSLRRRQGRSLRGGGLRLDRGRGADRGVPRASTPTRRPRRSRCSRRWRSSGSPTSGLRSSASASIGGERRLGRHRVAQIASAEWPLVEASFAPVFVLLLGWIGVLSDNDRRGARADRLHRPAVRLGPRGGAARVRPLGGRAPVGIRQRRCSG